ncbi:MAG: hypothetical protein WA863_02155 [Methyloceanibacter sp.]
MGLSEARKKGKKVLKKAS